MRLDRRAPSTRCLARDAARPADPGPGAAGGGEARRALPAADVLPARRARCALLGADSGLVTFVAPPGYGKSTCLALWRAKEPRPVGWVTVDAAGRGRHRHWKPCANPSSSGRGNRANRRCRAGDRAELFLKALEFAKRGQQCPGFQPVAVGGIGDQAEDAAAAPDIGFNLKIVSMQSVPARITFRGGRDRGRSQSRSARPWPPAPSAFSGWRRAPLRVCMVQLSASASRQ